MKVNIKGFKKRFKGKRIALILPYLLIGYGADKLSWLFRNIKGLSILNRLILSLVHAGLAWKNPWPSFHYKDLYVGLLVGMIFWGTLTYRRKHAKKYKHGKEYGTAEWGKPEDIKPFVDPNPENNIILTETESLTMAGRTKNPFNARNKNVEVIGGSGAGKTRYYVKPQLLQCHSSYVVTDPKGTILVECGKMLQENGYEIKVLNTINFKKSMHYNPFHYIRNEKDIEKLVNALILNTDGEGQANTQDFWVKAEKLYFTALIAYIWYEAPEEEQNFSMLIDLIDASETREDDEEFKNAVDLLFEDLEERDPRHFAVRQYKKYKLAAGKTAKSILISCGARMAPFDIQELRDITAYDDLEIDRLGEKKTAMFVIISDTDATFNFLVSLMYTQMFNLLCDKADDIYGGRLPIHVRFLLDEFSNIGQIPDFHRLITTIRSREMSASIILQSRAQLKAIYKEKAPIISENCDTTLFLGGKGNESLKEMEESLGKETINMLNTSISRGQSQSSSVNYQKTGVSLMSRDEIAIMDGRRCILQLRGVRPFYSNKYDITKHPRYRLLSDFDKKNAFDIEDYVQNLGKARIKGSDLVDEVFVIE